MKIFHLKEHFKQFKTASYFFHVTNLYKNLRLLRPSHKKETVFLEEIYTFSRKNHRDGNTSLAHRRLPRHLHRHLPSLLRFLSWASSLRISMRFVHPTHRSAGHAVPFSHFVRRPQPFTGQTPKPTPSTMDKSWQITYYLSVL